MISSKKSAFKPLKILITSGPTSVPIDGMRVITNRSTGEMGRMIANAFAAKGAQVTILEGAVTTTVPLKKGISIRKFYFFDELSALLRAELKRKPAVVIHAAAVSDYRLKKTFKGKLCSGDKISLELVPTKKLVADIKNLAPKTVLVGFKLETTLADSVRGARQLLKKTGCDLVVANCQCQGKYSACLVGSNGAQSKKVQTKTELVKLLVRSI